MTVTISSITADELLQMPDDGWSYELIRGEIKKMPPAGFGHGATAMRFGWRLAQFAEAHDLGTVTAAETGFLLSRNPDTVLAPDVAYIRKERVEQAGNVPAFWPGAPDLAVEVISPHDTYTEVEEKAVEWLSVGCRLLLVLNPRRRTVTAYRSPHDIQLFAEEETLDLDDVVPGFAISLKDLFC